MFGWPLFIPEEWKKASKEMSKKSWKDLGKMRQELEKEEDDKENDK